ncbi:MAG: hypothetical protein J6J36_03155 [Clostridia bacterium]|nr:hypothetical protein [Clostridia bacterium]
MEKKVILSIGLNDKDLHTQVITEEKALETIVATLHKNNIIGATLKVGNIGVYMGEVEKSIEAILYNVELENVKKACEDLKIALNQESIAVEVVKNVNVMFI